MYLMKWTEDGKDNSETVLTLEVGISSLVEELIELALSERKIEDVQIEEIEQ